MGVKVSMTQKLFMKKTNFTFISIVLVQFFFQINLSGQQQFSLNLDRANLSLINPANIDYDFFNNRYLYKASLVYKDSWTAFEGAPRTIIANMDMIYERDKVSILTGGQLYSDQAGRFRTNNVGGKIAALFSDNIYKQGISIGLSVNLTQYVFETSDLSASSITILGEYLDDFNMTRPNIGLGLFYYKTIKRYGSPDHFIYSGISAPIFYSIGRNDISEPVYNTTLHLFYNGGYVINLHDNSNIEFSTFTKYEYSSKILVSDIRAKYNFRGNFETQIGYSLDGLIIVGFGVTVSPKYSSQRYFLNYTGNYNSNPNSFRYFGAFHELTFSVAWGG